MLFCVFLYVNSFLYGVVFLLSVVIVVSVIGDVVSVSVLIVCVLRMYVIVDSVDGVDDVCVVGVMNLTVCVLMLVNGDVICVKFVVCVMV